MIPQKARQPSAFDSRSFRKVMGRFPTGVAILTIPISDSQIIGITINSLTSVSLEPPLVLFCMKKSALIHDRVTSSSVFCISILAKDQKDLALHCAQAGGCIFGRSSDRPLEGTVAGLYCSKEALYPGGDHSIVVGRVLELHHKSICKSLVFHASQFTETLV